MLIKRCKQRPQADPDRAINWYFKTVAFCSVSDAMIAGIVVGVLLLLIVASAVIIVIMYVRR